MLSSMAGLPLRLFVRGELGAPYPFILAELSGRYVLDISPVSCCVVYACLRGGFASSRWKFDAYDGLVFGAKALHGCG